jgi:hypothetical protein
MAAPPAPNEINNPFDPRRLSPAPSLRQTQYDFTSRVFPEDLGQEDNAHYMILNINVPVKGLGPGAGGLFSPQNTEITNNGVPINGTVLSGFPNLSTVDKLRFGRSIYSGGAFNQNFLSPPRYTRRIKESIALHMPNGGLVFTEPNVYEEVSMTAMAGNFVGGILSTLLPKEGTLVNRTEGMSLFNSVGSVIKSGSQILGAPINPRVEVLFSTRPQRQWVFEVFMLPRSETEAATVKQIIQTIRFYAAPEITTSGFFFVPPAEFDITFFFNGEENQNLPRINTCVLERIDVDYAPETTYSTFRNGQPIAVRMSLAFREVEILHKERVFQGF